VEALATSGGDDDAASRVVVDASEDDEAPVDGSQGVDHVGDRGAGLAFAAHALDQALHVSGGDVGNATATEVRKRREHQLPKLIQASAHANDP
jgi:hypothetical protein